MPYIGNITSDFSIDTGNITNRAVTATKLSPSSVGSNGQVLSVDGSGNLQWGNDANAPEGTAVLSTGESGTTKYLRVDGDGTCSWQTVDYINVTAQNDVAATVYPLFAGSGATATGPLNPGTDTGFTYNSSSGALTATSFVGALTGTASEFTVTANDATNETVYPLFADGASGSQGAETDSGLTYNPSTGILTSTGFTGTLQTAAQPNITSVGTLTALNVDGGSNGLIDFGDTGSAYGRLYADSTGTFIGSKTQHVLYLRTNNVQRIKLSDTSSATSIGGSMTFNAMLTTQGDISGGLLALKAAENTNRLFISGTDTAGVEVNFYNSAGGQRGIIGAAEEDFFIKAPNSAATMSFHIHDTSSIAEIIKIRNDKRILFGQTTNADIGGSEVGFSVNQNTIGQIYACVDDNQNDYYRDWVCNLSRRNNAGDGPQLALDRAGWVKASIAGLQGSDTATSAMGQFAIYTHDYSSGFTQYERLRINAAGSVGIGTSDPTERLHCTGNIRVSAADNNWQGNSAGNDLVVSGSSDRGISIISATTSSANIYLGDSDDTDRCRIAYQNNDNDLQFYTNAIGSPSLVLASNGYCHFTAGNDVRVTYGTTGTAGTNDSNWIRGENNVLSFNAAAANAGGFEYEIGGTQRYVLREATTGINESKWTAGYATYADDALSSTLYTNTNCFVAVSAWKSPGPTTNYPCALYHVPYTGDVTIIAKSHDSFANSNVDGKIVLYRTATGQFKVYNRSGVENRIAVTILHFMGV